MYLRGPEALANAKKQMQLGSRARRDDLYEALLLLIPAAEQWQREASDAAPIMDTIQNLIERRLGRD